MIGSRKKYFIFFESKLIVWPEVCTEVQLWALRQSRIESHLCSSEDEGTVEGGFSFVSCVRYLYGSTLCPCRDVGFSC